MKIKERVVKMHNKKIQRLMYQGIIDLMPLMLLSFLAFAIIKGIISSIRQLKTTTELPIDIIVVGMVPMFLVLGLVFGVLYFFVKERTTHVRR